MSCPLPGWRVVQVGGNLNNGSKAGVSYLNVNNDSSNDNSNIGARLSIYAFFDGKFSPQGHAAEAKHRAILAAC